MGVITTFQLSIEPPQDLKTKIAYIYSKKSKVCRFKDCVSNFNNFDLSSIGVSPENAGIH